MSTGRLDTPNREALRAEYPRRANETANAVARSQQMERDFLEKKVLNEHANEAMNEARLAKSLFSMWLLDHHAELFAPSEKPAIQAHSKTEYKRLIAQGANVLSPSDLGGEMKDASGNVIRPSDKPSEGTPRTDAVHKRIAAYSSWKRALEELLDHARQLEREAEEWKRKFYGEAVSLPPSASEAIDANAVQIAREVVFKYMEEESSRGASIPTIPWDITVCRALIAAADRGGSR